jgi:hypothetical protein
LLRSFMMRRDKKFVGVFVRCRTSPDHRTFQTAVEDVVRDALVSIWYSHHQGL